MIIIIWILSSKIFIILRLFIHKITLKIIHWTKSWVKFADHIHRWAVNSFRSIYFSKNIKCRLVKIYSSILLRWRREYTFKTSIFLIHNMLFLILIRHFYSILGCFPLHFLFLWRNKFLGRLLITQHLRSFWFFDIQILPVLHDWVEKVVMNILIFGLYLILVCISHLFWSQDWLIVRECCPYFCCLMLLRRLDLLCWFIFWIASFFVWWSYHVVLIIFKLIYILILSIK